MLCGCKSGLECCGASNELGVLCVGGEAGRRAVALGGGGGVRVERLEGEPGGGRSGVGVVVCQVVGQAGRNTVG